MLTLGLDCETTMSPRHYPYHEGAYLVNVCLCDESGWSKVFTFNHTEVDDINQAYCIEQIQAAVNKAKRLVAHNAKFDLLWMMRLGIDFSHCEVFCTQVADYLLSGQKKQSYKLEDVCLRYGITPKLDQVKVFWDSGYETDEIPMRILKPYVEQDTINTLVLFQRMTEGIRPDMRRLLTLHMRLLVVLTEMEHNGMTVCCNRMEEYVSDLLKQQQGMERELLGWFGWDVNLSSKDELSVALYGGVLKQEYTEVYLTTRNAKLKEPYIFEYKDGRKAKKWRSRTVRELVCKTRKAVRDVKMTGVGFKPLAKSELKKEGFYSTDKNTIAQLRAPNKKLRKIKKLLTDYSVVKKAAESFLGAAKDSGLMNKIQPDGCLHPRFNQTVAATGRLSSSDPKRLGSLNHVNCKELLLGQLAAKPTPYPLERSAQWLMQRSITSPHADQSQRLHGWWGSGTPRYGTISLLSLVGSLPVREKGQHTHGRNLEPATRITGSVLQISRDCAVMGRGTSRYVNRSGTLGGSGTAGCFTTMSLCVRLWA